MVTSVKQQVLNLARKPPAIGRVSPFQESDPKTRNQNMAVLFQGCLFAKGKAGSIAVKIRTTVKIVPTLPLPPSQSSQSGNQSVDDRVRAEEMMLCANVICPESEGDKQRLR